MCITQNRNNLKDIDYDCISAKYSLLSNAEEFYIAFVFAWKKTYLATPSPYGLVF